MKENTSTPNRLATAEKKPETPTLAGLEKAFLNSLENRKTEDLILNPRDMKVGKAIIDFQTELTLQNVQGGIKTFQVEKQVAVKVICAILANFNASVQTSSEKMDDLAIYEAAREISTTFTHEPLSDLILCLRMAKMGQLGKIYNRIDINTIMGFYREYLERKYKALEDHHREVKTTAIGSVNNEQNKAFQVSERNQRLKSANEGLEISEKNKKIGQLLAENEQLKQNKNGAV